MANEYAFDPTGTLPANRITDEQIIVLAPGDRKFHFTMPRWAPFFEDGLLVKLKDINNVTTTLVMGVDYYLSHKYADASLATMHPVWGSITFLDRTIVGTVIVSYNTLGGVWTLEANEIATILLNTAINPRITTWENVTNRQIDFPVINHPWNLDDMVGQKEILEALENFHNDWLTTIGINTGAAAVLNNHLNDFSNPHKVSAAQTGAFTKAEVNTLLTGYVTTTGTAANSTKFNNKTYQQVFTDVINTKVNNAFYADNADNANQAENSNKLNGKTLNQIMIDVSNSTVSNSNKFNGKTYQELLNDVSVDVGNNITNALTLQNKTLAEIMADVVNSTVENANKFNGFTYTQVKNDILSGNAASASNSILFSGYSVQEIINMSVLQAGTDALTLSGKSLSEIFTDVVNTKVNNAFYADNADTISGFSVLEIKNDIKNSLESFVIDDLHVNGIIYGPLFKSDYNINDEYIHFDFVETYIPTDDNGDVKPFNNIYYISLKIKIFFEPLLDQNPKHALINLTAQYDLNKIDPWLIEAKVEANDTAKLYANIGHREENVTINLINYKKSIFTLRFKKIGNPSTSGYLITIGDIENKNFNFINQTDSNNNIFESNPNAFLNVNWLVNNNIIDEYYINKYYTKTESDNKYRLKTDSYTKTEVNGMIVIASQAEAQAGTNNVKLMTPLRVKEVLTSQVYTKAEVDAQLQQVVDDLTAYINSL